MGNNHNKKKWEFIKITKFCASKHTINRVNSEPMGCEEIFASYISNKGLVSRMYKYHLQLNSKQQKKQKQKQQTWI